MNEINKYNYIFTQDPNHNNEIRIDWINNCLLGDIQTFFDGIDFYINNKDRYSNKIPRGAGNISIPILINTALEFVSALYVGKSKYIDDSYNATDNVKEFMNKFFNSVEIPLLFWDGVRNGITHMFSPKAFNCKDYSIHFQFFVEDKKIKSHIINENKTIKIKINIFEMYGQLKYATNKYITELKCNPELQDKFIKVWESIETYSRNIDKDNGKTKEVDLLINKKNNSIFFIDTI
jgi:hypothetical protein